MELFVQLTINSLIAASVYALLALGFNLVYSTTRVFNIAHGVLAVVGAYAVFYLSKILGLPYGVGIVAGVALAGLVGFLLDLGIYRPLRMRKASPLVLLIASLGAFTALQAIIAMIFSSQFQTLSPASLQKVFTVFGGSVTLTQVITFMSAIGLYAILMVILSNTAFGKKVRAVSDDEEVARTVGISTNRVIATVFFLGSAIAGLAGIFVAFDTGIQPTSGMFLLLSGAIASIIGGIGNVTGGVLGALLLGFVENFGIWKLSSEWKSAISFGLLIVFLLMRPSGIMNVILKK
jgi:branched-chain amino acid transport system permease protein